MSFTHEIPAEGKLQFLDLTLTLSRSHVCWAYNPRSCRPLLPFDSAHSKTVKRAIASMCLESALQKSCVHAAPCSFYQQVQRLRSSGYSDPLLVATAESLLQKVKGQGRRKATHKNDTRPEVIPYIHKVAHNLKKVANRHNVPIVFSAPRKLSKLCARISGEEKKTNCGIKHNRCYVDCAVGVVYELPLSCGKSYIGQTGRCVNQRAREHELTLTNDKGAHLPAHCAVCGCVPLFARLKVLGRSRETVARELLEAFYMKMKGADCVSQTSVCLREREFQLLCRNMQ